MPKIRKKQSLYINGDFIKKSGILTRSVKSVLNKNTNSKSFFKKFNFHNTEKAAKLLIPYNDEDTIDFLVKNVNPTLSVEDVYKNKTKVLHTPNEFNTDYKQNILLTKSKYNNLLEEAFIDENINFSAFSENSFILKDNLLQGKERIDIQLEFDVPLRLSKNGDSGTVNFNNTTFNRSNLKHAYYDFKNKKWDYPDSQVEVFNSISVEPGKIPIKNQSLGYPLTNSGFPIKNIFRGLDRHTLKIKDYITKPFYLEEVKIRVKASHYAEVSIQQREILNSLNFFIINQRKNLNPNAFLNLGIENRFLTNGYNHIEDINLSSENVVQYTNTGNNVETFSDSPLNSSQRELVTYLSLVNYTSGSISSENIVIDYENVKNNADYFYEDTDTSDDFVYEDKTIDIHGPVRTCISHQKLESMYNQDGRFYPECKYTTRTGGELNSERSLFSDFTKPVDSIETIDSFGQNLEISRINYKENPYEINPTDEFILGFSFEQSGELNPDNQALNSTLFNDYVMMLMDKVEVSLIGRYYIDEKPKKISYKNYNLKSQKKYENKVIDSSGMSNIYLNRGAFFDKNYRVVLDYSDDYNVQYGPDFELLVENYESAAYGFGSNQSGFQIPINSKVFNRYKKVYLEERVVREENESLPEVKIEITYTNTGALEFYNFNGQRFITFSLDKDKKYVFDTSDSSMSGRTLLLSKNYQPNQPGAIGDQFLSAGIIYNETPGNANSNITIIPEKFSGGSSFYLYFYDPNFVSLANPVSFQPSVFMTHDPDSYKRNHLSYDLLNFGMPIHKVYESKTLPFLDLKTNIKNYLVTKKFKNILLEDLDNPSITYNTDRHARKLDNKYNDNSPVSP